MKSSDGMLNLLQRLCDSMSRIGRLTKNWKMKETEEANPGTEFWNFNLPPGKTCPGAGGCFTSKICFGLQGRYLFSNVVESMEENLRLTKQDDFVERMDSEVKWRNKNARKKGNEMFVRVHDVGDYYSIEYARKWIEIAARNPDVIFYSYTKSVPFWNELIDNDEKPDNLHITFSKMGKYDDLIRPDYNVAEILAPGQEMTADMTDGTGNDMIAITAKHIALPYHGSRKWNND